MLSSYYLHLSSAFKKLFEDGTTFDEFDLGKRERTAQLFPLTLRQEFHNFALSELAQMVKEGRNPRQDRFISAYTQYAQKEGLYHPIAKITQRDTMWMSDLKRVSCIEVTAPIRSNSFPPESKYPFRKTNALEEYLRDNWGLTIIGMVKGLDESKEGEAVERITRLGEMAKRGEEGIEGSVQRLIFKDVLKGEYEFSMIERRLPSTENPQGVFISRERDPHDPCLEELYLLCGLIFPYHKIEI